MSCPNCYKAFEAGYEEAEKAYHLEPDGGAATEAPQRDAYRERTLDEQLIMLRLAARVDPLLREAVADVDDAVATLTAERESLARLLGEMMAERDQLLEENQALQAAVAGVINIEAATRTELGFVVEQRDALRMALLNYGDPASQRLVFDLRAAREALGGKSSK